MAQDILKMEGITKIYPNGVMANKDVDFSVREGEIHALMGENGAGKSTLMKILFGSESYDTGSIWFNGQKLEQRGPAGMIELGIGMVHQHFMLVDSLRVFENIILGIEPTRGIVINSASAITRVHEMGEKYNLRVDPMAQVGDLSVGLKQKVELLKVLIRGAKLLILDEYLLFPLKESEARDLLEIVEARHKVASTIFCSQFAVAGWYAKIGEPTLADAICDRIVHNSYTIKIDGDSMRKRKGISE